LSNLLTETGENSLEEVEIGSFALATWQNKQIYST